MSIRRVNIKDGSGIQLLLAQTAAVCEKCSDNLETHKYVDIDTETFDIVKCEV